MNLTTWQDEGLKNQTSFFKRHPNTHSIVSDFCVGVYMHTFCLGIFLKCTSKLK